jgi:hypothetical protein
VSKLNANDRFTTTKQNSIGVGANFTYENDRAQEGTWRHLKIFAPAPAARCA